MTNVMTSRSRSRWARGVAGAVLVATAALGASAWAQHGPGGPGMMSRAMFGGPPEHAARMIDHMLDGLNASDAQRSQIKQIAQAAAADLKTQRDSGRALHEKSVQLFTAPNVDALAAEQLRQQMIAQQDQASRRTLTAMLDISRVLTPEQRAKVAERMKLRGEAMRERAQRMERDRPPK